MDYDGLIIVGPTASGKTSISIQLAKELNTEIINADSMYLYKELNIGTAKPTKLEMQGIKHFIIDVANPDEKFNVFDYRLLAEKTISYFRKNNLLPIIVGGTGFYIDSLINNFSYGNDSVSEDLRNQINNELISFGKEHLFNKLKKLDPVTASKLHVNDSVRVARALEIILSTGNAKSKIINNAKPIITNPLIIGLDLPREILYEKINKRVDLMIKSNLVDEVRGLIKLNLTPDNSQSLKGIGYKEIYMYLNNEISLENAIEKIKQHTRNYAKRQITWFKRYKNIHWISVNNKSQQDIIKEILNLIYKK